MKSERLPTITSENRPSSESPMFTREGARRYGQRHMPKSLRACGFMVYVYRATDETNGWNGYRISYGKCV